ncbi:maleamate amidohydrolase [Roseovarius pacificus]|uniref:Maleamate amidohydrolase n=1 Tax=Roseovarius pacificus TaxID=337701 RepID=A0A1M7KKR5_9RHOB|nr:N-carbamoylsarcosine amidohydrolase [Roseovarius pacificus]GGO62925.1 N-carbamoylsarcosine amidase [Roseovarius pacificus]SHM65997.1 maleamate amidohydrolase [Roseovarius pacificus]
MTSATENYAGVWGGAIGFGKRPSLIMIDFMKGYTTAGSPLFAPGVVDAVLASRDLLNSARENGVPVIHTDIRYFDPDFRDGGRWLEKSPVMKNMKVGAPLAEFCDEVAPLDGELVLTKQYASAFFGTSLASTLYALEIDTIVLAGCSTSGCIRASAVDGVQHGFRVIVVRECVGDRHPEPHEANLFDIDSKYGDVVARAEAMAKFEKFSGENL